MKKILCLGILLAFAHFGFAQLLKSKSVVASFYSSTPLEDIDAVSKTGGAVINTKTGEILVKIANISFQFKKKLMQEHFNENYMESEKYPYSEFRGKLTGTIDYAKQGNYTALATGILNIHGISKTYQIPLKITVTPSGIVTSTAFTVKLVDHQIKIPTLVIKNIAEVIQVKINANFLNEH